jgi:hypothetical protein
MRKWGTGGASIVGGAALVVLLSGSRCERPLRQVGTSLADFYAAGNITILLCNQPQLNGCDFLGSLDVSGGVVKLNRDELPPAIGDDGLRSFQVVCGRPTAVIAFEHCNFRGQVEVFHCVPGTTLEVTRLPGLGGRVSGLAFSDETRSTDTLHTAIPFGEAVAPLHAGISTAVDVGGSGAAPGGSADCTLIPACCAAPSSGGNRGDDIEEAFPIATEVYWTEPINIFPELPQYDEVLTRVDECQAPAADQRQQLLAVAHHTEIDPDDWAANYRVSLYWYFEPRLLPGPPTANRQLALPLHTFAVKAEDGLIHDALVSGIGAVMGDAGSSIACQILSTVKLQGDLRLAGAGEAVLSNNDHLTWTFESPLPCNGSGRAGFACPSYLRTPPTLILHKKEP